jgi:hypothetical protein
MARDVLIGDEITLTTTILKILPDSGALAPPANGSADYSCHDQVQPVLLDAKTVTFAT